MNLFYKTETDSQTPKANLYLPKEKRGQGINQEYGITGLLYIKQINNKDLLYSTGNSTQYLVITYNGRESEKEYMCVWVMNHLAVYLKLTQYYKSTIAQ